MKSMHFCDFCKFSLNGPMCCHSVGFDGYEAQALARFRLYCQSILRVCVLFCGTESSWLRQLCSDLGSLSGYAQLLLNPGANWCQSAWPLQSDWGF